MHTPFIPENFEPPEILETPQFRLRMLSVNDVVKDYDAVMTSVHHLQKHFGYAKQHSVFGEGWPPEDLSLMDDLSDLGWHQTEFKKRSSFTYTVVNSDESRCLGCVYILPAEQEKADAEVYLWVRADAYDTGLDPILFSIVQKWIDEKWPFAVVAYPGRK